MEQISPESRYHTSDLQGESWCLYTLFFFENIYSRENKKDGRKEGKRENFCLDPILYKLSSSTRDTKKKSIITCRIWFNGVVSDIWAYHTVCMIKNAHIGGVLGARFFEKVYLNRYFFNFSLFFFFLFGSSGQNVSQVCFH